MRIAVTGTPGTGKTTAASTVANRLRQDRLEQDDTQRAPELSVVHLNELIQNEGLTTAHDETRDSAVVDMEAVADWLAGRDAILFESHLAHRFDADRVVVLRCHPEELTERLGGREKSETSIAENAESEAIALILSEAVERHGRSQVYEIDTTGRTPEAVADDIEAAITGEREPSAGEVSFLDYL